MKNSYVLSLLVLAMFVYNSAFSQNWAENLPQNKSELTLFDYQDAFNAYWDDKDVVNGYFIEDGIQKKAPGWKQFKRWEWYWEDRVDPVSGRFPDVSAADIRKETRKTSGTRNEDGKWTSLGPTSSAGGYAGLGRINCAAFIDGIPDTYFVGSPSGGLWKTTDDGDTWTVLTDDNDVLGVSDILVYPSVSGSETIYIATGDRDGGSISSLGGGHSDDNHTIGVLKSTDGGTSWSATDLAWLASDKKTVNRLIKHPASDDSIWAACTDGVFLTTDGGDDWDSIMTGIEFIDMEMKPMDPMVFYGSTKTGDIYKSSDMGDTWELMLSIPGIGRIELAVSPDEGDWVYALAAEDGGSLGVILKSTDIGETFDPIFAGSTPGTNLLGYYCDASGSTTAGQGGYDLCIAVDPMDAGIVYIGGINTWKSSDAGMSWDISNMWTPSAAYNFCGAPVVHADKHNLIFQPGTGNLLECNDGGFYRTSDGGATWDDLGNGLIISQLYRIGVSQSSIGSVIAGLQDNGTKSKKAGVWKDVIGGDGMECFIDYTDADIQYGEIYYGDAYRTKDNWATTTSIAVPSPGSRHWVTPFAIDPTTPTTIYLAYDTVWKSTDQGDSWSAISGDVAGGSTLKSMAIAQTGSDTIYVAKSTALYGTTDGGATWTTKTGTLPVAESKITYISVKHDDAKTLWVSMGEYNDKGVFESTDGGSTWTNISSGLPLVPVMCVAENKQFTDSVQLYAATDVGVYVKNGIADWALYSEGLPNVVVTELEIYYDTASPNRSRIVAATYGRGLWESELYSPPGLAPTADFMTYDLSPLVDSAVAFTDLTIDDPTSWSWTFTPSTVTYLNGTTSASQNPEVSFDATGDYTVELEATNAFGSDTETKTDYITVIGPAVWSGATSKLWGTASNWVDGVVPDSSIHVVIPSGATFYPELTSSIMVGAGSATLHCKSLMIQTGGEMLVDAGADMLVVGDLKVDSGGTLNLSDDLYILSGGRLFVTGGTITNTFNYGGFGDLAFFTGSGGSMSSGSMTFYNDIWFLGGDWHASGGFFHLGGSVDSVKMIIYDSDLYLEDVVIDKDVTANILSISTSDLSINGSLKMESGSTFDIPPGDEVNVADDFLLESDASGAGSLINEGTFTVAGATAVQRYIPDNSWHLISSPVSGETASALYFSNSPTVWLKKYLEPTNDWEFITSLSTPLTSGRGWAYWIDDVSLRSDVTILFEGSLLSTDLTLGSFEYSGGSDFGYNLVGNPFPSALDWDVGSWDTTDINGSIWVWKDGGAGDGTGTFKYRNAQGLGSLVDGIIPMAQGFFIQVSGSSPSLTIPADARTHSTISYYKEESEDLEYPYTVFEVNVEGKSDEVWVAFAEQASTGFDHGWDVNKLFSFEKYPQLYIEENELQLSIDALPLLEDESRMVHLSFAPEKNGLHLLKLKDQGNMSGADIILEDVKKGVFHDFLNDGEYSFLSFMEDDKERFTIHFNPKITNINTVGKDNISIYASGNIVYINYDDFSDNAFASVYDIYGREIVSQKLSQSVINTLNVNGNNSYVMVRVIDKGVATTKKVFIR